MVMLKIYRLAKSLGTRLQYFLNVRIFPEEINIGIGIAMLSKGFS